MRNIGFRQQIQDRLSREPKYDLDGPSMNLRNLLEHPVVGHVVAELLQYRNFDEGRFLHLLRDPWRKFLWNKVSQTRPEHYGSAAVIDRKRTLLWHDELQVEADKEDSLDNLDFDKSDVRAKLGILRRLLAGGLMTPERYARHKKLDHSRLCACGQTQETVQHVSWECERYADIREPLLRALAATGRTLESLPKCFYYATVVHMNSALPDYLVKQAQQTLVQIWQLNIQQWYAGEDLARTSNSNQRTFVGDLISENGHMLAPRENQQGMWCRLCGKYTNNMKHIRLKITKNRCLKEGGALLDNEGFHHVTTLWNKDRDLIWTKEKCFVKQNIVGKQFFEKQHCVLETRQKTQFLNLCTFFFKTTDIQGLYRLYI